ncbi:hypothetical protein LS68_008920 [Helicobacter sp. MIT 05-5293]|uniref:hypothetical protein n=1 Tax=Helicobacter sp. MIT 05-5293 TaxID=1548149 RepID=UPI00051DE226|nr:hypothetical protein [Helicobacter sp. MIT 05-5293]TLD79951.1 hypothetical protein LS68_008920 [Helicobacter sp. MIT 05-5293]
MKKIIAISAIAGICAIGANALDLNSITKGLQKGVEAGEKAGVVKTPEGIYKANTTNKDNIEACIQYYHKAKISYSGRSDLFFPDDGTHKGNDIYTALVTDSYDKDEAAAVTNAHKKAKEILQKEGLNIKKYSNLNKDLVSNALCQQVLVNGLDAGSKKRFAKDTEKYDWDSFNLMANGGDPLRKHNERGK